MHNGKWEKRRCRYYSADTGHTGCIADGNIYKMQQSIASLPSSSSKQSNNKTNKKTTYSPALSLEFPNFVFYKIHLMVSSPSKFSFSPYLHHLPSNPHHQKNHHQLPVLPPPTLILLLSGRLLYDDHHFILHKEQLLFSFTQKIIIKTNNKTNRSSFSFLLLRRTQNILRSFRWRTLA